MTIFAGAYATAKDGVLPESLCAEIQRTISRHPQDSGTSAREGRFFVAKVDIQAYSAEAFRVRPEQSIAVLAGEPLLDVAGAEILPNRGVELGVLQSEWDRDDWSALLSARGVFNAAYYNVRRDELCLIADRLGARPLYYWQGQGVVVFATALRILEELQAVPKAINARGLAEHVAFGYALSNRTPYETISVLKAAEVVRFAGSRVSCQRYWKWDALSDSAVEASRAPAEAFRLFKNAVSIRLRGDTRAVAFLSGGLDSRCVTAALRDSSVMVHTLSFGSLGSQDRVFAEQIASRLQTIHHQVTSTPEMRDATSRMMAAKRAWDDSPHRKAFPPERPLLLWSGDGGSVGVGHVYLTRAVVDLMRAGNTEAAIAAFLRKQGIAIPRRLLQPEFLHLVADAPERGIREELDDIHSHDPGRAFHLFLMLNDQRRHLTDYYENIDVLRFEQHLPFFDSRFLEFILSLPVDRCLGHRFYMEWFRCFPPAVAEVPWQAYPGHEPCPLPLPTELSYQWAQAPTWLKTLIRQKKLSEAKQLLKARDFPSHMMRRDHLRLASWMYRLRVRDYSPTMRAASAYYAYWQRCGERFSGHRSKN